MEQVFINIDFFLRTTKTKLIQTVTRTLKTREKIVVTVPTLEGFNGKIYSVVFQGRRQQVSKVCYWASNIWFNCNFHNLSE